MHDQQNIKFNQILLEEVTVENVQMFTLRPLETSLDMNLKRQYHIPQEKNHQQYHCEIPRFQTIIRDFKKSRATKLFLCCVPHRPIPLSPLYSESCRTN